MTKNISIIPYYEPCPHNCWFCIWKGHPLEHVKGPSIDAIDRFLEKYKNLGYWRFSISGSDAIFENMNKYDNWWDNIFQISDKYNMLIDIHTRSRIYNQDFLETDRIRKLVLSTTHVKDCERYIDWLWSVFDGDVRLVKVVTQDTTEAEIKEYIELTLDFQIQMTFKQLYGYDDGDKYNQYKQIYDGKYKHVVFLDIGDYNIYLMPDNKEHNTFINRKRRIFLCTQGMMKKTVHLEYSSTPEQKSW